LRKESHDEVIIFYSGAPWGKSGGGQRPQQLALNMVREGRLIVHLCHVEERYGKVADGIVAYELMAFMRDFGIFSKENRKKFIGIVCLPCRFDGYYEFVDYIVYDIIDDWNQFSKNNEGGIDWYDEERDVALMNRAEAITCSAHYLRSIVNKKMETGYVFPKEVHLIPNGGPSKAYKKREPLELFTRNRGEKNIACVSWVGAAWWDWNAISQVDGLCARRGWKLHLVGDGYWNHVPKLSATIRYGIVPHVDLDRILVHCDVGIVPFHGPICTGVDPIKRYENRAARIPTVAGADLIELRDEPDVIMVSGNNWEDAVLYAVAMRENISKKITDRMITECSWKSRAKAMEKVLQGAMRNG
jgi:hypothetical protein